MGGNACFYPDKAVSRGEFLAMVVKVLDIPTDDGETADLPVTAPQWLKPYLAAAQRSGLMADWKDQESLSDAVTGAEAAVMLQNALDLTVSSAVLETEQEVVSTEELSAREAASLTVLAENGVELSATDVLTRGDVAQVLYRVSKLALEAPGMTVFRMQQ